MKKIIFFLSYALCINFVVAQTGPQLSTTVTPANEFVVNIGHVFHLRYGCMYPMTYQLDIPSGSSDLHVQRKYTSSDAWSLIPEKTSEDYFNAIEAVRFDYATNRVYVSAAFSPASDSLFLQIIDGSSNPITPVYSGISKYYDNRVAAVTVSADDYSSDSIVYNSINLYPPLLDIFRSYKLYVTVGIVTNYVSPYGWTILQQQLDSGYVEAASHSRTHSHIPYDHPYDEVVGSHNDIVSKLRLPELFRSGSQGYVYTWIPPFGEHDSTVVDSLVGAAGYLAPRIYEGEDTTSPRVYIYGDTTFANWNVERSHFMPFFPSLEIGAPSWGGGDTSLASLNGFFDAVIASGGIYHFMWHPQTIFADRDSFYLRSHLEYVSQRKNIWYVNLGHLYLYHLLQNGGNISTGTGTSWTEVSTGFATTTTINTLAAIGSDIFVGTDAGVFHTTDNGLTWPEVDNGLTNKNVNALAAIGSNLFAGTEGNGAFLSTDNGANWTAVNSDPMTWTHVYSLATNGPNLFAGTGGPEVNGVFLSTDNGTNWTAVNSDISSVYALAVADSNLYAGSAGSGAFLSADTGKNWTAINTNLTKKDIYVFAVNSSNLFAGTDSGGVFLSTDNGTNWTDVSIALTNADVYTLAVNGTDLFAGTYGGGVFLSHNNGTTWAAINAGLTSLGVNSLAIIGTNIFAGTDNGVWKLPLPEVLPVELLEFTATSLGTSVQLIWKTATEVNNYGFEIEQRFIGNQSQGSSNWKKIGFIKGAGTSNKSHSYSFLDLPSQRSRTAYRLKQIDNDGSFKYSQSVEVMIGAPAIFSLRQNFPNPFNPSTSFSIDIPLSTDVSLKVYDLLGREVASVISEKMNAGTYTRQWNASGLSSGVYFYRLKAGSFIDTKKLVLLK